MVYIDKDSRYELLTQRPLHALHLHHVFYVPLLFALLKEVRWTSEQIYKCQEDEGWW